VPKMLFPRPFAKPAPPPSPVTRSTKTELGPIPRAIRLQKMREEEQAEMRKQAVHMAGEWISTGSGVTLFIPERMFEVARRMQNTQVGATRSTLE
jgi:hypothetical protein